MVKSDRPMNNHQTANTSYEVASEPPAGTLPGIMPGRIAGSFIGGALIFVVIVRLMGLFDLPWPLGDPAFRNILTLIFSFVAVATAWIWFVVFSGYSAKLRWWTVGGTVALVLFAVAMFRLVEVSGTMIPTFA